MVDKSTLKLGDYVMFSPSGRARIKPRKCKIIRMYEKSCIVNDLGLELELFYESASTQPVNSK